MCKFENQSFEEMRDVTFAQVSPDEAYIVYGVGGVSLAKDKNLNWLHLYDIAEGKSRQLTYAGNEASAVWLDSRTVLFPAVRGEDAQNSAKPQTVFYALDIFGGEAYELFRVPVAEAAVQSLGNGRFLLYGTQDNSPEQDGCQELFEVYDEYPYHADGRGYVNKKRARLWLYDQKGDVLTPLTEPLFQVNQVMNNRVTPILSPDKKRVYYWGETVTGTTHPAQDVYVCDLETGKTRLLFKNDRYMLAGCVEAGNRVYFYGLVIGMHAGADFFGSDVISIGPGESEYRVELAASDYVHGMYCRGESFYLVMGEHDRTNLYVWKPGGRFERWYSPEYMVEGSLCFAGKKIYYPGRAPMSMRELVEFDGGQEHAVTDVGGEFLKKYSFTPAEELAVPCAAGHTVYGWVVKPHDYQPGKKYPGLLMIHGGPQSAYTNHLNFSMQRYAAEGYFVFFCNPRGSTNYGRAYMELEGQFGIIDFEDFMAFTDAVLERYPDIDGDRLGVTGGSYGGYMTNWIIGHTDRFKGAIAQRSISNWISMYGCTDISYFITWGQCGTPWSNLESLWFHSPLKYADNFKTPTLLLQNARDFRCPVEQAEQMLTALIERGIPARMVLFHHASHGVMTPRQRRRNDDEVIAWLDRYVKAGQAQ